MKIEKVRNSISLLVILINVVFMPACKMPTLSRVANIEPSVQEISRSSSTLTLAWDYDTPASIDHYNLYYRVHVYSSLYDNDNVTSNWVLLDTVSADSAEFVIDHSLLGDGSWDFGVTAVNSDGEESEIHSSLDQEAIPETGWFLRWEV